MPRNSDFTKGQRVAVYGWTDSSIEDGTEGVVLHVPAHGYIRVRVEGEELPLSCTPNELRPVE